MLASGVRPTMLGRSGGWASAPRTGVNSEDLRTQYGSGGDLGPDRSTTGLPREMSLEHPPRRSWKGPVAGGTGWSGGRLASPTAMAASVEVRSLPGWGAEADTGLLEETDRWVPDLFPDSEAFAPDSPDEPSWDLVRPGPSLGVATVTYRSPELAGAWSASLLRGLRGMDLRRVHGVVVDNSPDRSTEAAFRSAAERLPFEVSVLHAPRNLGFAGGMNVAFESLRECDQTLMLTPDIQMGPGAAAELSEALRWLKGRELPAMAVSPTYDGIFPKWVTTPTFEHASIDAAPFEREQEIWSTRSYCGACALFDSRAFHAVGGLDPNCFFGGDESDLTAVAHRQGYRFYGAGRANVTHPPKDYSALTTLRAERNAGGLWVALKHAGIDCPWSELLSQAVWHTAPHGRPYPLRFLGMTGRSLFRRLPFLPAARAAARAGRTRLPGVEQRAARLSAPRARKFFLRAAINLPRKNLGVSR